MSDVSGPVAMTTNPSGGTCPTSSRRISISGRERSASVTPPAKRSRPIASASPAGTAAARAQRITSESSSPISPFKRPTALDALSDRTDVERTSAAERSLCVTAVHARLLHVDARVGKVELFQERLLRKAHPERTGGDEPLLDLAEESRERSVRRDLRQEPRVSSVGPAADRLDQGPENLPQRLAKLRRVSTRIGRLGAGKGELGPGRSSHQLSAISFQPDGSSGIQLRAES